MRERLAKKREARLRELPRLGWGRDVEIEWPV